MQRKDIFYLPTNQAREVVRRSRLVASYVAGCGARCVFCGEWDRAETGQGLSMMYLDISVLLSQNEVK